MFEDVSISLIHSHTCVRCCKCGLDTVSVFVIRHGQKMECPPHCETDDTCSEVQEDRDGGRVLMSETLNHQDQNVQKTTVKQVVLRQSNHLILLP